MFFCRMICGWLIWFCVWFEVAAMQRYYADHCLRGGRISWGGSRSCLLPRATLSCLQSTQFCMNAIPRAVLESVQMQYCVPLPVFYASILSKNLFFDHFLATRLPQGQLCCFNWLTLFNSCFNSQHNHHNCINCAIFQYQQLPLPFICF